MNGKELSIDHSLSINGIDASYPIADVFLLPNPKKGYFLLSVGKNGEIFPEEAMEVRLYHKYFAPSEYVSCTVTTDYNGLFELGQLNDIIAVEVLPQNTSFYERKRFDLLTDLVNVPSRICRKDKTRIAIPFSAPLGTKPKVRVYDDRYSSDISNTAKYEDGYVVIEKLPPADYVVFIDSLLSATVKLHVSGGSQFNCHLGRYVGCYSLF